VTRSVLWDSSAVLALLDADDADHARAVAVAREIAVEKRSSFITNYIEAEAHALLVRKLGRAVARQWLLTGGLPVVRALPPEEEKARAILARHIDKDWTLCDAISFAVLDTRRVSRAFTFDHHFRQYGRIQVLGLEQRTGRPGQGK
jgi:predicted nucleic acid-binding protein